MEYQNLYDQMKTSFEEETGATVYDDSDLGIRMQIVAGELYHMSQQIDFCMQQMFPQTATGIYLEHHGACRDLYKKPAAYAKGTLVFSRQQAAQQDILIPEGTLCSSSSNSTVMYQTEEEALLAAGTTSVEVPGIATVVGTDGNLLNGKIDTIVSTIAGVDQVTNSTNFSGGMAEETDESFRKRLLDSYLNVSNGANMQFYEDFAMSYSQIVSAKAVFSSSDENQLQLYVSDYFRMTGSDVIAQIQQDIQKARELNINVTVAAAQAVSQNVAVTIYLRSLQGASQKRSEVVNCIREQMYALGVGESFNPYAIAAGMKETVNDIVSLAFTDPTTVKTISPNQIIKPGTISVTFSRI